MTWRDLWENLFINFRQIHTIPRECQITDFKLTHYITKNQTNIDKAIMP